MKISIQSYRIYGSKSQYGQEPRGNPFSKPFVISNHPQENENSEIILGEFPKNYEIALRVRKAFVKNITNSSFTQANGGNDHDKFDGYIRKTLETSEYKFSKEDWNWYLTFVIMREIEIEDKFIKDRQYFWLNTTKSVELKEQFHQYSKIHLDRLASLALLVFGEDFISNIVVEDEVFCTPDKMPFSQWDIVGHAPTVSIGHLKEELDFQTIESLLNKFRNLPEGIHKSFDSAEHWYLAAIKEADPWKKFMWGFLSMEILANKISNQLYDPVVKNLTFEYDAIDDNDDIKVEPWIATRELCPPKNRLNLTQKFTIMAVGLKSKTVLKDIETFKKVKKSRDRLSHGDLKNESELPLSEFSPLLRRYFQEAIKYYLHNYQNFPLEPPENMQIRMDL